eukprot:TRINITY_DN53441_c0_g1_i1.p2 TRINITY_DN53441_c0_g1~~TRINITY_DN53441_c0_g1_i1.p2  ORF type:complete len:306 (+),score=110.57 TRINITY_DN53441_c0_g1_i1:64-918(+)
MLKKTLLLAAVAVLVLATDSARAGDEDKLRRGVRVDRVMEVRAPLSADRLLVQNLTTAGNVDVQGVGKANELNAQKAKVATLSVGTLKPVDPRMPISIEGNIELVNGGGVQASSFLAEHVVVRGVPQWKLVRHENFDQDVAGWSLLETSACMGSRDRFLGGHCNIADGQVTKRFENLPPHNHVRVTARYHMIDNWQGETAFLKLGEHIAWADHSTPSSQGAKQHGIDMCGSKFYNEKRMSIPVDVSQDHTDSFLQVSFGSTGLHENEDPCQRSFGVDDVMVYVR